MCYFWQEQVQEVVLMRKLKKLRLLFMWWEHGRKTYVFKRERG